jgi:GDPmannose 4,6-dehydratase
MKRRALVTGGSGQDGWFLIELLLTRGYDVHAQSRHAQGAGRHRGDVRWHVGDISNPTILSDLIEAVLPHEIYNLASASRPIDSWKLPYETAKVNALVPQQICELVLELCPNCRIFQATSSEIFGDIAKGPQNEATPCCPQTPYGIAKLYAHLIIGAYRKNYGLKASSGIMFNHESPRRPLSYVSQKIAHAAAALALGFRDTVERDERGHPLLHDGTLHLGDLNVRRDFGFAGDYVEIMHLMLQSDPADDYVIGTGETHSIGEFCEIAFRQVGLDWRNHVVVDRDLYRAVDSHFTQADCSKAVERIGWRPSTSFVELVSMMVKHRIGELANRDGNGETLEHCRVSSRSSSITPASPAIAPSCE